MRGMGKGTHRKLSRQIAAYEQANVSAAAEASEAARLVPSCTERHPCLNCQECRPLPGHCTACGEVACACPWKAARS